MRGRAFGGSTFKLPPKTETVGRTLQFHVQSDRKRHRPKARKAGRTLVAEVDVLTRIGLAQTLRDEHWQVIEAGSAVEAPGYDQPSLEMPLIEHPLKSSSIGASFSRL